MASKLNEESVEKKLKTVNNTQDSIQSLSLWIIHHKSHHAKIVELWMKVLKKTVHPSHRLTLFYLCNDVVQTCKKKKAYIYNSTFKEHLTDAAALVRDLTVKSKVERIFNIWGERGVYDTAFVKALISVINGRSAKDVKKSIKVGSLEEADNGPISPPSTPYQPSPKPAPSEQANESISEHDAEESARILAEFKPHEMIEQITAFQRQKSEIKVKMSQLSLLKLDASSIEAVKHLKDRSHGNDFSSHFEDSCMKLEDLVKRQNQQRQDQKSLLATLQTSETFYEEQYREAKIVANAYKNFGARINNMKKRLDELKKSFPEPDSPIPSPDVNAPSPGNTPPHADSYGYNPAKTTGDFPANAPWGKDVSHNYGKGHPLDDNPFDVSPPLEAPSPEGSPQDLNLGGSETTSASFESRLASFFDSKQPDSSGYTPRLSTKSYKADDDGSTTPLDDETPTTPVQDEHLASPPKRNTPPKKENSFDYLTRLISGKTGANPTTKSGTPSFLDSLSPLLSNVSKPAAPLTRENSRDTDAGSQAWDPWKPKSNETITSSSQPSSPSLSYPPPPQSSSPTHFPPPGPPTMVPPPIPMPVPPPIGKIDFSLPPPPPPPMSLTANFSSPPPGFQQTSPGQKENWPERQGSESPDLDELGGVGRSSHSSVLKELVPDVSFDSQSGSKPAEKASTSLIDPDAMEISEEEEDLEDEDLRIPSQVHAVSGAKAEFAEKLKQKTSGPVPMKSHIYAPSGGSNLLTLTGNQGGLNEEEMMDDHAVNEDSSSAWSQKSRKHSHKSRSRSHSRERSHSHKHKKKKKHKRSHSSEDEDGYDGKNIGSVVKRMDPREDSRKVIIEDKYNRDVPYDRRYDALDRLDRDDRDYNNSRKSFPRNDMSKDYKDPVEAYTAAYREAMAQQLSQRRFNPFPAGSLPPAPHVDPRRGGNFRKY